MSVEIFAVSNHYRDAVSGKSTALIGEDDALGVHASGLLESVALEAPPSGLLEGVAAATSIVR